MWNVQGNTYDRYLNICKNAAHDDAVFNTFKSNTDYTSILEHCPKNVGDDYVDQINNIDPSLLRIDKFFDNDKFGSPVMYDYKFRTCSATTLSYISVLALLINKLNSLENFDIVEIGGGYGGQAKIITDYFKIKSYSIIDLEEVTLLQDKYIQLASIPNTETYTPETYDKHKKYDLVISSYALSEINDPLQSEYVNNIVLNSMHGFLSINGSITLFDTIETTYKSSIEKLRLPIHSKMGNLFSNKACYLIW